MAFLLVFTSHTAFQLPLVPLRVKSSSRSNNVVRVRCEATPATSSVQPSRRAANYQPSSWDYHALLSSPKRECSEEKTMTNLEKLKMDVRHLLYKTPELVAQLQFIDAMQRLGISYHFEKDIKDFLISILANNASARLMEDLHATSLLFRLLRENGFEVSQDIFDGFRDDSGNFKASLCKDIQGMLSLYEASYLAFDGDFIMDQARLFTTMQLKSSQLYMVPHLKEKVDHALALPLHWRTPRLEANWYIDRYEKDENVEPALLQLAKLDFNQVQSVHREELRRMTKWWRDLGLVAELAFIRDRLVECFFFAMGIVSESNLGYCREGLTKVSNMITTLDDVYDIHGTLDELVLFTITINRWESKTVEGLPNYMQRCYFALYDMTNDMAYDILRKDGRNVLPYLKRVWADLCNCFLVEAQWHKIGYVPTFQGYLDNAWMSASGHVLLVHAFILSRQDATEEALQCLEDYPSFIQSSSLIFRLCNDLATSKVELERGDVPTSIQCYMHEYGVTEEVARKAITNLINDTWKRLNRDVANCDPFPKLLADAAIGLARIAHCTYHKGDGIGSPDEEKKNQIMSLFFNSITI